jgi:preprotein translocase subunit Sec61beta
MRVLPFLGVVGLWAVTLGVPGSRVLQLDARKYNLSFEARDIPNPGRLGDRLGEPATSPLRVQIRALDSDRLIQLKDYSSTFTMSGDRDATAFATVQIPRRGRYQVTATSAGYLPYFEETVVRGEPVGPRVIWIVGGAIVAVLAFLATLIVLVVSGSHISTNASMSPAFPAS